MPRKASPKPAANQGPRIYTNENPSRSIVINIGFPTVLGHPGADVERDPVRISFTDGPSRTLIAEASLSPAQFVSLIRGGDITVVADHYTKHPERIGKRSQNVSASADDEPSAEIVADAFRADGWEQVDVRRTNTGYQVVARRWIEDEGVPADA